MIGGPPRNAVLNSASQKDALSVFLAVESSKAQMVLVLTDQLVEFIEIDVAARNYRNDRSFAGFTT